LPGTPTVPEQIASDEKSYHKALEAAEQAWVSGRIDVSALEDLLREMLAQQMISTLAPIPDIRSGSGDL